MELYRYLFYQIYRVTKWTNPDPKLGAEKLLLVFQSINFMALNLLVQYYIKVNFVSEPISPGFMMLVFFIVMVIAILNPIKLKDVETKYKDSGLVGIVSLITYVIFSCLFLWYAMEKLS